MQVTGKTQGKRMWKANGGVHWAPRASPTFSREPYSGLSQAQHTLLLMVETPGLETWQLATQGCRATPPYLPAHSHQELPQWAARNGEKPFKRYGSPTRYWADRYWAYSLGRH